MDLFILGKIFIGHAGNCKFLQVHQLKLTGRSPKLRWERIPGLNRHIMPLLEKRIENKGQILGIIPCMNIYTKLPYLCVSHASKLGYMVTCRGCWYIGHQVTHVTASRLEKLKELKTWLLPPVNKMSQQICNSRVSNNHAWPYTSFQRKTCCCTILIWTHSEKGILGNVVPA